MATSTVPLHAATRQSQKMNARSFISWPRNAALAAAFMLISIFQYVAAPALIASHLPLGVSLLLTSAILSPFQWAVIHEAMHGNLFPAAKTNELAGRFLAILFGVSFHGSRFGHLAHHRFNRCAIDRPEIYDPATESWIRGALRHYAHLCGGMYVGMSLGTFLSLLPQRAVRWTIRRVLEPADGDVAKIAAMADAQMAGRFLNAARVDAVCIATVWTGAAFAYGALWPWALLALGLRALMISCSDNSYHYATPADDRMYARNHSLPRFARGALLNMNLHRVHHLHPQVPWRALPDWDPSESAWDSSYMAGLVRQLKGPVPLSQVAGQSRRTYIEPAPGAANSDRSSLS